MDNIQEIWKDIAGYEGYYQVSDQGRVRNIARRQRSHINKILAYSLDTCGYPKILLSVNGVIKPRRIHRLVAEAFHKNPEGKPTVNHKNRNKEDNRADNLEWATTKEQGAHRRETKHLYIALKIG